MNLQENIRRILREEVTEDKNLYGEKLRVCSTKPMTGFYRDGYCRTGDDDTGSHTVCAKVTEEFLEFTKSMGNNLDMLEPGDKWCLCAKRWEEANKEGVAPEMIKSSTNIKTLDIIDSDEQELDEYARTLKNARRQGVGLRFPKSAVKANPQRFRKYTRDNIKESVAPQVRRRHGEFDKIFLTYRDSFIDHEFRIFKSFWNLLMESSLETLYHTWFKKTVSDDNWQESAEYIENYLIEKYYDDTKKMWEKKHRKKINESEDKNIEKNLRLITELLETIDIDGLCKIWVEYNPEDGDYEIRSTTTNRYYDLADMTEELDYIDDTIRSWKLKPYIFTPNYVENCEDEIEFMNESDESRQERKFTKLLNNIEEYINSNSYNSVIRVMVDYDEVMDDVIVNIFFDAEHAVKLGGGINSVIKRSGKKIMEDLSVFPFDFKYHIHFEKPQLNESIKKVLKEETEGIDSFLDEISSKHNMSDELRDFVKQFIEESDCKRINFSRFKMGVMGLALESGVLINSVALNHPLPFLLFLIFHEVAHQYQFKKYGEDVMYDCYLGEISERDAAEFMKQTEEVADEFAGRKIRQLQKLNLIGPYTPPQMYKNVPIQQITMMVNNYRNDMRRKNIDSPKKVSEYFYNMVKSEL